MQFSNTTSLDGIVQGIDFEVQTNDNTYGVKDKTRNVNRGLDRFIYLATSADNKWQFDDTNHTNAPVATADIVADQKDYTFSDEFLIVTRLETKDTSGNWRVLPQIDERETSTAYEELQKTSATPTSYDVRGKQIYLFPPSDTNVTGGLRVFFQRKPSYMDSGDTVKEPGIPLQFHEYLILYASHVYAQAKGLPVKNDLFTRIQVMEQAITNHFRKRNEVKRGRMTVRTYSSR